MVWSVIEGVKFSSFFGDTKGGLRRSVFTSDDKEVLTSSMLTQIVKILYLNWLYSKLEGELLTIRRFLT